MQKGNDKKDVHIAKGGEAKKEVEGGGRGRRTTRKRSLWSRRGNRRVKRSWSRCMKRRRGGSRQKQRLMLSNAA